MTRSAAGPAGDAACADLHLHTRYSSPVAASDAPGTPRLVSVVDPEEAYEAARRRGMSFVAITDRGTLDGALSLRHYGDVILGEEVVVRDPTGGVEWTVLVLGLHDDADHRALTAAGDDAAALRARAGTRRWVTVLADPLEALLAAPLARRRSRAVKPRCSRCGRRAAAGAPPLPTMRPRRSRSPACRTPRRASVRRR